MNATSKPEYYRQRSVSWDPNREIEQQNIHLDIHLVRRKSLGHNTKLALNTPTVVSKELNNSNELIISIPVLISDANNNYNNDDMVKKKHCKDFEIEMKSCDDNASLQSTWTALQQMLIPFLIAGIGSVSAGLVLNNVQHWPAFDTIPQLMIMVPAFLGLTGNIETTLASRLSTHANLGTLDDPNRLRSMMIGNAAVVQCQASTVGLFAAFSSLIMSLVTSAHRDSVTIQHTVVLAASSVISSIVANTLLSTILGAVIVLARRFRINPDNISTPIAASMGDVCTITLLAIISNFLFIHSRHTLWLPLIALIVPLLFAPVVAYIARRNAYTKSVILTGWVPILGAVIFEQPGGIVMESAFDKYEVMSTFQPLVNGIASNLVGIQTSRLSTFLHQTSTEGKLPKSNATPFIQPFAAFLSRDTHSRMALLLLSLVVPTHFLYLVIIRYWRGNFAITAPFLVAYMAAVLVQVFILLYLAYVSVLWAWSKKINPDNSAIPFTSALADVSGNTLMALAFTILNAIGDINAAVDDGPDYAITALNNITAVY